jgi:hypothetical protein
MAATSRARCLVSQAVSGPSGRRSGMGARGMLLAVALAAARTAEAGCGPPADVRCGVRCLVEVCRAQDNPIRLSELADVAWPDEGISLAVLAKLARGKGLVCQLTRFDRDQLLARLGKGDSAILHVGGGGAGSNHFVAAVSGRGGAFVFFDGFGDFYVANDPPVWWDGAALLVAKQNKVGRGRDAWPWPFRPVGLLVAGSLIFLAIPLLVSRLAAGRRRKGVEACPRGRL